MQQPKFLAYAFHIWLLNETGGFLLVLVSKRFDRSQHYIFSWIFLLFVSHLSSKILSVLSILFGVSLE